MPKCTDATARTVFIRRMLILVGISLTTGCAALHYFLQKPTATFTGMNMTAVDLVQSTAVFHFALKNPNPIALSVSDITYALKLNGRNFMNGRLEKGITLAASGTSTVQVPVTIAYLNFFKSAADLFRAQKADYALNGAITVGPFTIPFQTKGTVDLPKMPKITLKAIRIRKFSLRGATLDCRLQVDNPNAFDFQIKRLAYHLKLAGMPIAQANALSPGPIGKHGHTPVDLEFDISFAQMGRSAYQLLQGAKADYRLDGALILSRPGQGAYTIPFNSSGKVPLERF